MLEASCSSHALSLDKWVENGLHAPKGKREAQQPPLCTSAWCSAWADACPWGNWTRKAQCASALGADVPWGYETWQGKYKDNSARQVVKCNFRSHAGKVREKKTEKTELFASLKCLFFHLLWSICIMLCVCVLLFCLAFCLGMFFKNETFFVCATLAASLWTPAKHSVFTVIIKYQILGASQCSYIQSLGRGRSWAQGRGHHCGWCHHPQRANPSCTQTHLPVQFPAHLRSISLACTAIMCLFGFKAHGFEFRQGMMPSVVWVEVW